MPFHRYIGDCVGNDLCINKTKILNHWLKPRMKPESPLLWNCLLSGAIVAFEKSPFQTRTSPKPLIGTYIEPAWTGSRIVLLLKGLFPSRHWRCSILWLWGLYNSVLHQRRIVRAHKQQSNGFLCCHGNLPPGMVALLGLVVDLIPISNIKPAEAFCHWLRSWPTSGLNQWKETPAGVRSLKESYSLHFSVPFHVNIHVQWDIHPSQHL